MSVKLQMGVANCYKNNSVISICFNQKMRSTAAAPLGCAARCSSMHVHVITLIRTLVCSFTSVYMYVAHGQDMK